MTITRGQSPIIQDGKLIGAVTHVFINNPTRKYEIFIENMLEASSQDEALSRYSASGEVPR